MFVLAIISGEDVLSMFHIVACIRDAATAPGKVRVITSHYREIQGKKSMVLVQDCTATARLFTSTKRRVTIFMEEKKRNIKERLRRRYPPV